MKIAGIYSQVFDKNSWKQRFYLRVDIDLTKYVYFGESEYFIFPQCAQCGVCEIFVSIAKYFVKSTL